MQAQSTNRRNLRMREREVARIPIEAIRPNPACRGAAFTQEALEELALPYGLYHQRPQGGKRCLRAHRGGEEAARFRRMVPA